MTRHPVQTPFRRACRLFLHASLLALAGLFGTHAAALELPRHRSVPGGVAIVDLGASSTPPRVTLDNVPVLVVGNPAKWTAVVGIALAARPGTRHLEVRRA